MMLDKKLTQWQLYHMVLDPDFEPILPLIVDHEHAYPELQRWYATYQATGDFGIVPEPNEPEARSIFARKGKLPSLQQVDAYSSTDATLVEDIEVSDTPSPLGMQGVEQQTTGMLHGDDEQFDERVHLAFDWRIVQRAGIAVVMCLVLVGLVIGGVQLQQYMQRQQIEQTQADCRASVQLVQDRQRAWRRLLDAASTKQVLAYKEQDVADKQVLTQLRNATQTPTVTLRQCEVENVSALRDATDANVALSDKFQEHTHRLRQTVKTAISLHRKQLQGQRGELQVAINGAQALLDSSSGNVADNATRDALQQAITNARNVYQDDSVNDVSDYITVGKALVDAQNAVQASIDAKVQADEQAQQQAAQDAQPQTPIPSPNYVTTPQVTSPSKPHSSQPTEPPTWSVPDTTPNPLPDTDGSL